jgi:hypothetical protein
VLFAAESLTVKAQGLRLLLEALKGLQDEPDLLLLSVGQHEGAVEVAGATGEPRSHQQ